MSVATDTTVKARIHPSPNHGERSHKTPLDMLVLHYTGMDTKENALRRLMDPRSEVSAQYLVDERGAILQLVPESRRAWHAGQSFWKGETDINSRSIGIEIVNAGHDGGYPDFPVPQIRAVILLASDICQRHAISPWMVLAHSDVAPERKLDPGEKFPWRDLARAGIGHYVEPEPIMSSGVLMQHGESGQPVEALQSMLALYGYNAPVTGVFDAQTAKVVEAFQRHFRPERVDGVADQSTIVTLHRLLSSLPSLSD
ncbi:N-acetylmuramoyl-L-alanine amidase [Roseibium aquae]|uniref:N-acetylmuramoyl-L-alanine amidase n=1 Tax=Roseibium aquae TaxID=1323746 RepID=A0A916T8V9_9HYPH|nr:N-acetylmuramoyl-L-alanine amidase [Roseibium aquae]GGB36057.1 N-acetylmuramoyl-L-alanine amidase [Roseibium aquae]